MSYNKETLSRSHLKIFIALSMIYCFAWSTPAQAENYAELSVRVNGADPNVGNIGASLYGNEDDFLKRSIARHRTPVDDDGAVTISFGPQPPGIYAIGVYWDEDGDGEMKTGLFGIPKEEVGMSNDARPRFGPPKWKDARFTHGTSAQELKISLAGAKD